MCSYIFSFCVLFAFSLIVFWNCKKHSSSHLTREFYLQNLNNLRGIFALEIVIGHVVRYEQTILYPLGKFMICSVAFFFFVSAFGMAVSYEKKKDYVNIGFILSKPVYLLTLSLLIFILSMGVDTVCPNNLSYLISPLWHSYLTKTNWYLWSLIVFYLLFFFSYKYLYKFHLSFICIITILLSIIMYLNGSSEAWVASSFAFPFGLIVGEHFKTVRQFIFSRKGILTLIALTLFGLSCLLITTENITSLVFMRNSMCLASIIILLYICSFLTLGNHAIAHYLNKYSTEIYLSQFIWLEVTGSYGLHYMVRMPLVLTATFLSAMLLHPIVKSIKKFFVNCSLIHLPKIFRQKY